jgi:hypothetical protein
MIGGHDISFATRAAAENLEGAIRLAVVLWSEAVVENAETGEVLDRVFMGPRALPREVLVYKNVAARDSWARDGAVSENANLMVHIIRGPESLTVVVDDPGEPSMRGLLDAIRDHIYQDIFWMRADAA